METKQYDFYKDFADMRDVVERALRPIFNKNDELVRKSVQNAMKPIYTSVESILRSMKSDREDFTARVRAGITIPSEVTQILKECDDERAKQLMEAKVSERLSRRTELLVEKTTALYNQSVSEQEGTKLNNECSSRTKNATFQNVLNVFVALMTLVQAIASIYGIINDKSNTTIVNMTINNDLAITKQEIADVNEELWKEWIANLYDDPSDSGEPLSTDECSIPSEEHPTPSEDQ